MLQNQRHDNRHSIRLTKLAHIPNLKDVQALQNQAQATAGRTVELPFGEPPEDYVLTVVRDKAKGDWLWMLYRGTGSGSILEWSYSTPDCGVIHNVITAQFPGQVLMPRSKMVLEEGLDQTTTDDQSSTMPLPDRNYQTRSSQSQTSGFSSLQRAQRPTLEGELENLSVPNLLQSISMGKMTGRLEIDGGVDIGNVYFVEGAPLHCAIRGVEGDPAIVEIVGWTQGAFRFFPEPKCAIETVKKRLDWLLMEGADFDDQQKYLKTKGLSLEAVVVRKKVGVSEAQFEQLVSKGAVTDMRQAKAFYQAVDNKSSLIEVLRRRPLNKTDWVPILYTLIAQELVELTDPMPEPVIVAAATAAVDWTPVRTFEKTMVRQDTQLYTYPAFLYFMEKELHRFERFNVPFAIVLIDIGIRNGSGVDPLPLRGVREAARRIDRLKRKTDLLGHYETFGIGLLLPHTDYTSARSFASRIEEVIMSSPLADDISLASLALKTAASSCPESSIELGELLAIAKPGKN